MNEAEYFEMVAEWKRKWPPPPKPYYINLTEIRSACRKCGKNNGRMNRHHIASDFFFALHFPDHFAARYVEFHPDDVVKLCEHCHKTIHRYYDPVTQRMYKEFAEIKANGEQFTLEWCEKWKDKFRKMFAKWIKTKPKRRRKKKNAKGTKQ